MTRLKYTYYKETDEHQLIVQKGFTIEEVKETEDTAAFETCGRMPTANSALSTLKQDFARVHSTAYCKSCDEEPQGPSSKGQF